MSQAVKIYLLEDPKQYEEYARFSHVGRWTKGGICGSCGQGTSRLTQPLQIEWEPDSDKIGDLSWCGYTMIALTKVRDFLIEEGFECEFGEVVVLPPSDKSRKGRVLFPYGGPDLHWVMPNEYIELDQAKSGVTLQIDCPACGQKKYTFRREGIVVNRSAWGAQQMFRIREFGKSAATFVTAEALHKLLTSGFKNIGYLEAGIIE